MSRRRILNSNVAYVSRTGWFGLQYPVGWTVQEGDESISIYNPDSGHGAINASAYRTPGKVDARAELLENLADNSPSIETEHVSVRCTDSTQVASVGYEDGDNFHKIWFVVSRNYLILCNYICGTEDKSELPIVEEIVESVEVEPMMARN